MKEGTDHNITSPNLRLPGAGDQLILPIESQLQLLNTKMVFY